MSVLEDDIFFHGSANMPEDDVSTAGGAIDLAVKVTFKDIAPAGSVQVVSSSSADTTQNVIFDYRDSAGVALQETIALNNSDGTTAVSSVETDVERLLKGVKSATTAGDVALEAATAERTGTADGGAAKTTSQMAYITLDSGASGSDDTFNGMILRTTGGTGPNQIKEIVDYRGSDKRAWVRGDWAVVPDGTTTFRVSEGMVFEKAPNEILTVVRPFFGVSADVQGGSARDYYTKIFARNNHATLALTTATIAEHNDPSGNISFGVAGTLDDTTTTTDRTTAPGGVTIDSSTKDVANSGNHSAGSGQGVWLHLSLAAGAAALDTTYALRENGAST